MIVFKREPAVERVLEFAAKFAVAATDDVETAPGSGDEGAASKRMGDLLLFVFNFMLKVCFNQD